MDHFVFPFPPITRKPTNMETWLLLIVSLCISALLSHLILAWRSSKTQPLPPRPFNIPILSTVLWLRKPFSDFEPTLRNLHERHGPIISLRFGGRPSIFIANRTIAHRALVQNGAVFADRPPALPVNKLVTCNQHDITSSSYGPTWRVLRRNLTSEVLHPSRAKSYSRGRKWVLDILINRLMSHSTPKSGIVNPVVVVDHVRYAMFCLLVLMCFGDKLGETQIKEIEDVQRRLLLGMKRFKILNLWPSIGKIVFRKRWDELFQLLGYLEATLGPLIEARKRVKQERLIAGKNGGDTEDEHMVAYVDTLLDLELPEVKRKLDVREVINLCSEFLDAGTDTSTTALQWIMANLVKYPHVQERLLAEIKGVIVGDGQKEVKEEDLHKLPYLKAVVLEGLRRHPPGHFVLPHAVTEDVVLDGYLVPKNGSVNFMVAEIGRDPEVWEDPMAFKPERFLSDDNGEAEVFDITGSREIKMMPFGAGRRMCPASGLAMLHLEYFVANLVLNFQWKAVDGDEVDLSEKPEFTTVMKYPLKAHLSPRF